MEADKLEELYCLFHLINLVKQEICFTINHKFLIDMILTKNVPLSNTPKHLKLVELFQ